MSDEHQLRRERILAVAKLAGLDLPAAYEDELVEAYGHIRKLVALLPQPRAYRDEPAHTFDPAKFSSSS